MKEAMLWKVVDERKKLIQCNLCARRCIIPEGKTGICLVRKNINGKLYSLNYGKIIAENIDPIEKKPLFHFFPGHLTYSIASPSCNFQCLYCCNWQLSQIYREVDNNNEELEIIGEDKNPEDIVNPALEKGIKIISYTYTEPTIFFEFAYETAKLAHKHGIKNTFVTNGYMTPEAVNLISKYLDAATVDFKGNGNDEFYRKYINVPSAQPIFDSLIEMKRKKIFIEITDLIIPKIGDNENDFKKLVRWIIDNLGTEIPFHIIRFFPSYKLNLPQTPIEKLEKLANIAKEEGLKYIYLGNVPGHKLENTYCPKCGRVVLRRFNVFLLESHLDENNRCEFCGAKINIIGDIKPSHRGFLG